MGSLQEQGRALIALASIGAVVLLILVGAGAAVFVTRRVTRPILALVQGTQEVAQGNLSFQVRTRAKDEIGALIESFNRMTEDLRSNREKLIQAERMAAWRDVARRIAHEIKNPLTPIELSLVRLGRRLDRSDEAYTQLFEECASAIRRQVESLRDMATEFSEFARMPEPKLSPCDLNGIVEEMLHLQGMEERNILVRKELSDPLPGVMGDQAQLRRALMNLMKNAVEAMAEGGTLRVSSAKEGEYVRVVIADTGGGMSEETARKMFDPYFTTKSKGTGLGMAIVRGILEAHGGTIEVKSVLGEGTEVVVRLPWKP
ncbi:MAG: ATP-binding protein [Candidatus Latescibacterota bacterium]